MRRVSLICTVHKEQGSAIATELAAVLERLQPDVIFVEVPPAFLDEYVHSKRYIESKAIGNYQSGHPIEIVPVDLPTQEDSVFRSIDNALDEVRRRSPTCRHLVDLDSAYIGRYGLAYLNSEHSSTLWSEFHKEALATARKMNDPELVEHYEWWIQTNDLRDGAMIRNVLEYCRAHVFERGVLLVGAAHRQSIIDKARDTAGIQWDFQVV